MYRQSSLLRLGISVSNTPRNNMVERSILIPARRKIKSRSQDKGHTNELTHFFTCLCEGRDPDLSFASCVRTSEITFEVMERLRGLAPTAP